ncbi:sugar nucleotide-binding protein [Roseobacter sp.]|uniref:sugar nucleotide-binding protein n=1 Tax=Roseobacter sp. TaxID=1907202 RepID=UPI003298ABB8
MDKSGYLVVGGDSLVGGHVVRALKDGGATVFETTRRRDTVSDERVFLDFETPEDFSVPASVGTALVIAAATNYDFCESDPMARVINVERVPRTVAALLERGLHVLFVSTNSVFGGERPWPAEEDPHAPGIAYAQQKSEGEDAILAAAARLGAQDRLAITRLTKILTADTSPLPSWIKALQAGQPIEPFEDLIFAPMSAVFVGQALADLARQRVSGSLHLSGAENVSYVAFAQAVADKLGADQNLLHPTTATAKGVHIAFKPTYSGLGMSRTTVVSGLTPQPLDDVLRHLFD